jgi:N-acetylmuramoyl-L-alanine amidase
MVHVIWRRDGLLAVAASAVSCILYTGSVSAQVVAAAPGPATAVPAKPAVDTTLAGDIGRTRFVVGLDRATQFQVFSLTNPNRVVIELGDVNFQLPALPAEGQPVGLVKTFRAGLAAPSRSRIVVDVTQPVVVETARIEKAKDGKSQRLALEIVPVEQAAKGKRLKAAFALGATGVQPPLPRPAVRPEVKAAKAFKPIIVVDPGHGGHDSGAMKHGAIEKEVVLAFGKTLREKLEATGRYKVVMTRDSDKFVELDERLAIGERNKANLFIAVHADYAGGGARGATIYSLKDSVASELKRSAKGDVSENVLTASEVNGVKQAAGDVDAVKAILGDLAKREVDVTKDRTNLFTRSVIANMGAQTTMRDDPDKQAAFRVLKTAQFPSVLIELAYVTNKQDALNLKSNSWRDKVADSIVTAIENYFSHQVARLPL